MSLRHFGFKRRLGVTFIFCFLFLSSIFINLSKEYKEYFYIYLSFGTFGTSEFWMLLNKAIIRECFCSFVCLESVLTSSLFKIICLFIARLGCLQNPGKIVVVTSPMLSTSWTFIAQISIIVSQLFALSSSLVSLTTCFSFINLS